MDANAGQRAAARERKKQKDALFAQEGIKFHNKETQLARTQKRNVIGYSRDLSDAYASALAAQGKGRKRLEAAAQKYFRSKGTVNEGGRSKRFGTAQLQGYLAAQSEVESVIDNVLRRNMSYAIEGSRRKFQAAQAQGREALGIPASYGAPVMLPPTNRLGGALQIMSSVASIYSGFGGTNILDTLKSDIRLKENIEQVGISPQGYKVYEFNYKGGNARFRGAMAQDVLQKNPMAVGIDQNYLTVDYSKIDVNMEVV